MISKVYSVHDSKVEAFLQPFFMQTKGAAIRAYSELVNDKSHQFGKYPSDYTLFELGDFDDKAGTFTMYPAPVSVGVGVEFLKGTP